ILRRVRHAWAAAVARLLPREHDETGEQDPFAPEPVAERPGRQEQAGEDECVGTGARSASRPPLARAPGSATFKSEETAARPRPSPQPSTLPFRWWGRAPRAPRDVPDRPGRRARAAAATPA